MSEDYKTKKQQSWIAICVDELLEEITPHIRVKSTDCNATWEWDDVKKLETDVEDRLESILDDYHARP